MLHEISRRGINISKHEETPLISHISSITLRADKYLHILEFSYNFQCFDKKLDLVESSIPCPKNSATKDLLRNCSMEGLKNIELTEMITNPYLWPYSNHLNQEMTNIMAFEWSPPDLVYNNQCLLAVLNSVGNLELFGRQRKLWISLLDFSSMVKQYLISESIIPFSVNKKMSLNKLKDIIYSISSSALCWAPAVNNDKSCHIATAQRNGCIFFWCLKFIESELIIKNIGKIQTGDMEITSMKWIACANGKFLFIYSNILGEIIGKICKINNEKLKELSTINIWNCKDKMVSKYISYMILEDKVLLAFDKHRHFVVKMYDHNFKLLAEFVRNINDERITAVTKGKDNIYVATVNVNIFKANVIIKDDALDLNLEQINLKDPYPNHELYSLSFSENYVICNVALIDRRVMFRKEQLKLLVVSLHFDEDLEVDSLYKNPSNKLTNMWDCIELMRYKAMKTKKLPSLDFVSLYKEAESDSYKMKVYLVLLKIYNNLEGILKNLSKGMLPETSVEVVQDKILAAHACSRLCKINEKLSNNCEITLIESQCLIGCKNFLEYYCKRYEKSLNDLVTNDVLRQIDKRHAEKHICQFCDDIMNGFSCTSGHMNMFCILTFTPIEGMEYLVCKSCNVTARMDLYPLKPACVFCDTYLDYYTLQF